MGEEKKGKDGKDGKNGLGLVAGQRRCKSSNHVIWRSYPCVGVCDGLSEHGLCATETSFNSLTPHGKTMESAGRHAGDMFSV